MRLGSYIPEPLSLEKKSQAREDTKRISEMVKTLMADKFFLDLDSKVSKEKIIAIFDKLFHGHNKLPSIEDLKILNNMDNIKIFLEKAEEIARNIPLKDEDINKKGYAEHTQYTLCHMLENIATQIDDEKVKYEITSLSTNKIAKDCKPKGKGRGRDRGGSYTGKGGFYSSHAGYKQRYKYTDDSINDV